MRTLIRGTRTSDRRGRSLKLRLAHEAPQGFRAAQSSRAVRGKCHSCLAESGDPDNASRSRRRGPQRRPLPLRYARALLIRAWLARWSDRWRRTGRFRRALRDGQSEKTGQIMKGGRAAKTITSTSPRECARERHGRALPAQRCDRRLRPDLRAEIAQVRSRFGHRHDRCEAEVPGGRGTTLRARRASPCAV